MMISFSIVYAHDYIYFSKKENIYFLMNLIMQRFCFFDEIDFNWFYESFSNKLVFWAWSFLLIPKI